MPLPVEFYADGGNNNCDVVREWDAADKVVWNKITPRATAVPQHHIDMVVPIELPAGFSDFQTTAFKITYKTIGAASWVQLMGILDSAGVEQVAGLPAAVQNVAKSVLNVLDSALTGTFTAGTVIYLRIRGMSDVGTPFSANTAMIGLVEAAMKS
jgi:hypothetical protein